MYRKKRIILYSAISIFAALSFTIAVVCLAFTLGKTKLNFSATYYYVYYKMQDSAVSASSISSAVQNLGGAGYIVKCGDKYYITIACYYDEEDAQSVCENLKGKLYSCDVLEVEVKNLSVSGNAKNNANKYSGNLTTLHSLSKICYLAANGIDSGEYDQTKAKGALDGVMRSLNGLLADNVSNPFTSELARLIAECEDVYYGGYVYSRDVRKVQVAITDCIANINLN